MASFDDVARIALALPDVREAGRRGMRTWLVADKTFAWERPFTMADIKRFGETAPPAGPILAVRVPSLAEKDAVLMTHPRAFFTIPHFDGFAAVLIQMRLVGTRQLHEALVEGWSACAPPRLAEEFWRGRRPRQPTPG